MFKRVFFPPPFFPSWWEEWLKPESKGRDYQKKKKNNKPFPTFQQCCFPLFMGIQMRRLLNSQRKTKPGCFILKQNSSILIRENNQ